MENYKSVPLKVITEELQITDAPIKALVKKGLLSEKYVEVYRNPYDDDDFEQTKPFPLTEEQKQVITPILSSITNETYNPFYYMVLQEAENRSIFTIYSSGARERKRSYCTCS